MQIVQELGGYTLGRADLVRRAMSKKRESVMIKERSNFVYGNKDEGVPGCIARGIQEEVANKIFDEMMDFAKYAFNKSHAAVYAYVAMQTAYLKYYHPVEYMAALMTSVIGKPDKCARYILHCHDINIDILPPSINDGEGKFTAEKNSEGDPSIRFGMYAVKNVGRSAVDWIVKERRDDGPYSSIDDFVERISNGPVNRRAVECLIKSGALDCIGGNRRQKVLAAPEIIESVKAEKKEMIAGQMSLFDYMPEESKCLYALPNAPEYDKKDILAFEKEVTGIYLSGHPLDEYRGAWESTVTAKAYEFAAPDSDDEGESAMHPADALQHGEIRIVGGIITDVNAKYTKNQQAMAFVNVEDLTGTIEVIAFPSSYEQYKNSLKEDEKVFIEGTVSVEDDKDSKLICRKMWGMEDTSDRLWLAFDNADMYQDLKESVIDTILASPGSCKVVLYLRDEKRIKTMPDNMRASCAENTIARFKMVCGDKNVVIRRQS